MRSLERWRRLPAEDRALLFEALPLVVRIRLALSVRSFQHVRVTYPGTVNGRTPNVELEPVRVAQAVRRASRWVPAASCLTQALATRVLLARHGHASTLRFGVAKNARGALEAHAWVEHGDRVLIGELPDLERFHRLPDLPGDP